ncbi:MAG TPA: extracellular solute-binding protein [Acholeplasma sp.]|nr:extracellular solute-binding protein [Acholeplasma sp.]
MKKVFSIVTILVLAVVLAACDRRPVLKVFLPLEYIGEDFLKEFNKNSEYRVEIIEFESNEDMLSKYNTATYDLIIPSDYALEELVSKDALLEIDWNRIDTFKQTDIDESLMAAINMLKDDEVSFDLLKYGVPYFWGSFGIIYDKTKVNKSVLEQKGWNILEDGRDQMLYDSSRDMIMVGLKQYYANNEIERSVNNPTNDDLAAVQTWLTSLKGNKTQIATEEVYDLMLDPTRVDLALAYSGDAAYLIEENPNLDYFVPVNQGTNIFIDAVVIPKTSSQIDFAYDFINFLLDKENAYANSLEIAFTSPRADVIEMILENEDYQESAYKILFNEKDELFRYNSTLSNEVTNIWQRVLAA